MGLKGKLAMTHERYQSETYTAQTEQRRVHECIPLAALIGDVPAAVSKLFAPVLPDVQSARGMNSFIERGT
jgi:hypothetical protein